MLNKTFKIISLLSLTLIFLSLLGLYITYPKWAWIDEKEKLKRVPKSWRNIKIDAHRNELINELGESLSSEIWQDKGDIWIKEDKQGSYELRIFCGEDSLANSLYIFYFLGNKEVYKRFHIYSKRRQGSK